jgi:integrase
MAYIKQFRDGWRAQVQKHGTRVSKVFDTKRDAQKWARDTELGLDALKGSGGMTFEQACTKYLATVAKKKAPGAAQWEERRLAEMSAYFGEHTPLATITSVKLGDWRDWRLETVSGSTVIRHFSVLRCLFRVAVEEWKVLEVNPCKGVWMPEHNPARHQVWTWQLIRRVLRAENRNDREIETMRAFHIALHTGMRLSEILRAKVVGKVAVLERDKGSGKASPPVKVPLARKGAALFAKYPPFTIRADVASATFSDLTDELLIDGLTFHDARASSLTWLSRRLDVMTLARISRHKNMKILMDTYYRETAEAIAARI